MGLSKQFRVWQKTAPVSVLLESRGLSETLLFESDVVAVLSQSEAENIRKSYAKYTDTFCSLGVLRIYLDDHVALYLFLVTSCDSIGRVQNSEIYRVNAVTYVPLNQWANDDLVVEVKRLLSSGRFYFARAAADSEGKATIDITRSMQNQMTKSKRDSRFLWNKGMFGHLEKFGVDIATWTVPLICGGVEIKTVYAGDRTAKAGLFFRLSCERAGTRFNTRGIDDKGHVANFVETEQVIFIDDLVSSFVQLRGSVPLFWEQPGFQAGVHKVKLSRGFEASATAFERHFSDLLDWYGPQFILNLLGMQEGENILTLAYEEHFKTSCYAKSDSIRLLSFDYRRAKGRPDKLRKLVFMYDEYVRENGLFLQEKGEIKCLQNGTIRTNCMDCLDRTNSVQTLIGLKALLMQLKPLGLDTRDTVVARFEEAFRKIWSLNGDHISRLYAGTGALDSKSKVGKLVDGAKSVSRTFQNNFLDSTKQEAINLLLQGNVYTGYRGWRARSLLPYEDIASSPQLVHEMCARASSYTVASSLRVAVGTWNVNGGKHFRSIAFRNQSMHDWLLDGPKLKPRKAEAQAKIAPTKKSSMDSSLQFTDINSDADPTQPVDVYAIGFEELVDLNTSNIISASSTNRKEWGAEIERVLSRDHSYVLLTAEQLVGVCLYVFVRPHLLRYIRDVAVSTVKTGLSGKAGNKGAVAIRFLMHSTSLCFVCAHLAAGHSQVANRNQDYSDINRRLTFPMGHSIGCHDYVFWCGDFNYRIDMAIDQVKEMVQQENWKILQAYDQLNVQRQKKTVFEGFLEGRTNFSPTYKYDLFSDDYDTSEKSRIPAWTDRVLWRRLDQENALISTQSVAGDVAQIAAAAALKTRPEAKEKEREKEWDEGRLVFYNRAELKTSDHRPVLAILDVEIESVDEQKRHDIRDEVRLGLGPSDPTIIISDNDGGSTLDSVDPAVVVSTFQVFGDIVLIRLLERKIFITYGDARSAVAALEFNRKAIEGVTIAVRLKSTWPPDATPRELSPDADGGQLTIFTSDRVQFARSPVGVRKAAAEKSRSKENLIDIDDDDVKEEEEFLVGEKKRVEIPAVRVEKEILVGSVEPIKRAPPPRPVTRPPASDKPAKPPPPRPAPKDKEKAPPQRPPRPAAKPDRPPRPNNTEGARMSANGAAEKNRVGVADCETKSDEISVIASLDIRAKEKEKPRRPPRPVAKLEQSPSPIMEVKEVDIGDDSEVQEDCIDIQGRDVSYRNTSPGSVTEHRENSEQISIAQVEVNPIVDVNASKSVSQEKPSRPPRPVSKPERPFIANKDDDDVTETDGKDINNDVKASDSESAVSMDTDQDQLPAVVSDTYVPDNPFQIDATPESESFVPERHSPESFEDVSLCPSRPPPPPRGRSSTVAVAKRKEGGVARAVQIPARPRSHTSGNKEPPPRPKRPERK